MGDKPFNTVMSAQQNLDQRLALAALFAFIPWLPGVARRWPWLWELLPAACCLHSDFPVPENLASPEVRRLGRCELALRG